MSNTPIQPTAEQIAEARQWVEGDHGDILVMYCAELVEALRDLRDHLTNYETDESTPVITADKLLAKWRT